MIEEYIIALLSDAKYKLINAMELLEKLGFEFENGEPLRMRACVEEINRILNKVMKRLAKNHNKN